MDNSTERRMPVKLICAGVGALAALLMWPSTSTAEADARWSARLGFARASFDAASTISVVGSPIDLPVEAGGSLQALAPPLTGTPGEVRVAPIVASAVYAPRSFGRLRPYAGAGVAFAWVLGTESDDVRSLRATSEWGVVLHAGCDALLGQRWSVFVDARKLYAGTSATGVITALGGMPVAAAVDLDPLILNAGIGYRF